MFTFGASRCIAVDHGNAVRADGAGVRSITRMPGLRLRKKASFFTCAPALVASNTKSISANPGMRVRPSTPSWVVATPMREARARPSGRVDADHGAHLDVLAMAQDLDHQIRADIAAADDGGL
jgi:hypothetical protein